MRSRRPRSHLAPGLRRHRALAFLTPARPPNNNDEKHLADRGTRMNVTTEACARGGPNRSCRHPLSTAPQSFFRPRRRSAITKAWRAVLRVGRQSYPRATPAPASKPAANLACAPRPAPTTVSVESSGESHVRLGLTFPRNAGPSARRSTQSPCPAGYAADEGPSPREHNRAAYLPSAGVVDARVLWDAIPHTPPPAS